MKHISNYLTKYKNMIKEIEITSEQIDKATADFCPFGYRDIEVALKNITIAEDKGYVPTEELYQIVKDYMDNTEVTNLEDIDCVYCVYDYYHQKARTDIENKTSHDICNEKPYQEVDISGNYMCTSFDGTDESINALKKLIETIPEPGRTPAVNWLYQAL